MIALARWDVFKAKYEKSVFRNYHLETKKAMPTTLKIFEEKKKSPNPIVLTHLKNRDPIKGLFTLLSVCQNNEHGLICGVPPNNVQMQRRRFQYS